MEISPGSPLPHRRPRRRGPRTFSESAARRNRGQSSSGKALTLLAVPDQRCLARRARLAGHRCRWRLRRHRLASPARRRPRGFGQTHVADLEKNEFCIEPAAWNFIAMCFYLQVSLFESSKWGLKPGGIVLVIVHITAPGEEPTEHRLRPGDSNHFLRFRNSPLPRRCAQRSRAQTPLLRTRRAPPHLASLRSKPLCFASLRLTWSTSHPPASRSFPALPKLRWCPRAR